MVRLLNNPKHGLVLSEYESEKFIADTPNDIISPGCSDGGEISP